MGSVLAQDGNNFWWMVSGVLRHRLTSSEANSWLWFGMENYPKTDPFAGLLIGSSSAV